MFALKMGEDMMGNQLGVIILICMHRGDVFGIRKPKGANDSHA